MNAKRKNLDGDDIAHAVREGENTLSKLLAIDPSVPSELVEKALKQALDRNLVTDNNGILRFVDYSPENKALSKLICRALVGRR